jgi:glycosidase
MPGKFNNSLTILLSLGLTLQSFCLTVAFGEKPLEAILPNTAIALAMPSVEHRVNIPIELEKTLKNSISTLYGEEKTDEVFHQISDIIHRSRIMRLQKFRKSDLTRSQSWYKSEIIYLAYVHGFDGKIRSANDSHQNLKAMLPYLKQLGITTLRILPPPQCHLEQSAQVNKVNSPCHLLARDETLKSLIEAAHSKRIKIEYDFLALPNPTTSVNNVQEELEHGGTLPLNSLYPLLEKLSYWSNQGIDIFHLDANLFVDAEHIKNQAMIQLISSFIQATGPRSILHVEARQDPEKLHSYFGIEQTYIYAEHQKLKHITRGTQAQIVTHFSYAVALWSSLILANNQTFWDAYLKTPPFTEKETWAFFLRNQDELNFETLDPETQYKLHEQLLPRGEDFQKGKGVSGRLADFLNNNPVRISEAFDMLLSLPGIPMIYYGDAIAARSNHDYAKYQNKEAQKQLKKTSNVMTEPLPDSRHIHRAPIEQKHFYKAENSTNTVSSMVYQHLRKSIAIRQKTPALNHGQFLPVFSDDRSVLSYIRYMPEQVVLIVHNLSDKPVQSTLTLKNKIQFTLESSTLNNLITGQPIPVKHSGQKITLSLQPYQSCWFIL